jgi:hypothetical protein
MLHGPDWVAQLAIDLKLNVRSLQRMLAGDRPFPDGLARDLVALIDARRNDIARSLGLETHPQDHGLENGPQDQITFADCFVLKTKNPAGDKGK